MTSLNSIHIINGPNLNLLGRRELPEYNKITFLNYFIYLQSIYADIDLRYYQSNHEGGLIDYLQECGYRSGVGVILNPGAYTHTSIAIADTVAAISAPVIEVHLTNIMKRESYRHVSYIRPYVVHHIMGRGLLGYEDACKYLIKLHAKDEPRRIRIENDE